VGRGVGFMSEKGGAIKKKQQIDKASRKMFFAVAVASFLAGFAVVATVFIFNKMVFNAKVISEKNNTHDILLKNNSNIIRLAEQVRALEVDESLLSIRLNDDEQAFRVVLDALPAIGNSTALGASLKEKILAVPGVLVESIIVNPTIEESSELLLEQSSIDIELVEDPTALAVPIDFTFKIVGSIGDLSQALKNMERSIRPMIVTEVRFEVSSSDNQSTLAVTGRSFYEPMLEARLGSKEIRSDK
jgi:hypothetical protein